MMTQQERKGARGCVGISVQGCWRPPNHPETIRFSPSFSCNPNELMAQHEPRTSLLLVEIDTGVQLVDAKLETWFFHDDGFARTIFALLPGCRRTFDNGDVGSAV